MTRRNPVEEAAALALFVQLDERGLPRPEREYRFHPTRKWLFDHAWPQSRVAVECEGGAWSNGRHTRGDGYIKDMEKYNEAALLGWIVLRFTPDQIMNGEAIGHIHEALKQRKDHRAALLRDAWEIIASSETPDRARKLDWLQRYSKEG